MSDYSAKLESRHYVGLSGGGKTSQMLADATQPAVCRFIFDPSGQMSNRLKRRAVATARDVERALPSGWVIFNPHVMFKGQQDTAFLWFCHWAFEASKRGPGRKLFLADEIWQYCSAHKIPRELATISQMGRVEGLVLMTATQVPHKLPDAIWGQATDVYCFQLVAKLALDYMEQMGCNRKAVATLPPFTYLRFDPRKPTEFRRGMSPKI